MEKGADQMQAIALTAIISIVLPIASFGASQPPSPDNAKAGTPKTVESRIKELGQEYDAKFRIFHQANMKAKTIEDRKKASRELRPDGQDYARRFLALAQENPKSPSSLDALSRVLLCSIGRNSASEAAIDQLRRDWTTSPRMAEIIFPIGTSMCPNAEGLLREILARNPDRNARGPAVLVLAVLLQSYASLPMQRDQDPGMAQLLDRRYGKDQIDQIAKRDLASLLKESEDLYERAAKEFADVKLSPRARETVGTFATKHLAGLRELAVGKPAPEIEGEDIGGKRFKLSEYRGKVVLLVFWASWCGPCLKQVPHELALVKRLEGKPFVLLGVNIDRDRGKMESAISHHGITWRNWYDGGNGKIQARYNIQAVPLVLLLDPAGTIFARDAEGEALDRTIDSLLEKSTVYK